MGRVYRPARASRPKRAGFRDGAGSRTDSRVVVKGGERSLELDGTFASYYEPGRVTTGSVWDAIAAGLLALPPARRRRILLLGLGGGSAARVVRALAPQARIVGVELDPGVIELAREWFALDSLGIEVVLADAREYLVRARGRFDAVFEDVFVGTGDDAIKPDGFPHPGLERAARRLAPGGVLVVNTLDDWSATQAALAGLAARRVRIELEDWDNRIYVAGDAQLSGRTLRRAVAAEPLLADVLPQLSFRAV